MNRSSLIATGMVCATALVISTMVAVGGPLNPPAGAINSSQRLLESVTGATEINSVNTPGMADSVFTITQPGAYILTQDIVVPAGMHGIKVLTDTFIIDHGGHEIRGLIGSLDGVHIEPTAGPAEFEGSAVGADIRDMGGNGVTIMPAVGGMIYQYDISNTRIRNVGGTGIFKGAAGGAPIKDTFTVASVIIDNALADGIDANLEGGAGSYTYTYDTSRVSRVGGVGIRNTSASSGAKVDVVFSGNDICTTGGAGVSNTLIGTNVSTSIGGSSSISVTSRSAPLIDQLLAVGVLNNIGTLIRDTGGAAVENNVQVGMTYSYDSRNQRVNNAQGAVTSIQITPATTGILADICFIGLEGQVSILGLEVTNPVGPPIEKFSYDMRDSRITNPGTDGVRFDSGILNSNALSVDIRNTSVVDATGDGFDMESFGTNQSISFKCVNAQGNGLFGAKLGNNAIVKDSTFNANDVGLSFFNDCHIINVQCNRNSSIGMTGQAGNLIESCTANFSDAHGVVLANENIVLALVVNRSGTGFGDGLRTDNNCTIKDCLVTQSSMAGIVAGAFCVVSGNNVTGSGGANIQVGDNSTVSDNIVQNGFFGIMMTGGGGQITGNTVGFHADGIVVQGFGNTITDNTLSGNTGGTGINVQGNKTMVRGNHVTNFFVGIAIGGQNNIVVSNTAGMNAGGNILNTPTGVLSTENLLGEIFNQVLQIRTILNETDSSWGNLEI